MFWSSDMPRFAMRDGKPSPLPREQWRVLPMQEIFDALLYLGPASTITTASLPAALCADAAYRQMRRDRMLLLNHKAQADEFDRDCGSHPRNDHGGDVDMRRWTLRILVGLCGLIVVTAITGATYQWLATRLELATTPPPGHLVDIGGHRLHLWCTGDGVPAVILDTGLGGSTPGWGRVQPEVARFTRVCS